MVYAALAVFFVCGLWFGGEKIVAIFRYPHLRYTARTLRSFSWMMGSFAVLLMALLLHGIARLV